MVSDNLEAFPETIRVRETSDNIGPQTAPSPWSLDTLMLLAIDDNAMRTLVQVRAMIEFANEVIYLVTKNHTVWYSSGFISSISSFTLVVYYLCPTFKFGICFHSDFIIVCHVTCALESNTVIVSHPRDTKHLRQ
jgi:hypothetical protein